MNSSMTPPTMELNRALTDSRLLIDYQNLLNPNFDHTHGTSASLRGWGDGVAQN